MKRNEALAALEHPEPVLDFVRRARERLSTVAPAAGAHAEIPMPGGEHELSPDLADLIRNTPQVPAAVLVPVIARETPTILLTQRSVHLPTHAGQIAFPGGRREPGEDAVATALRETEEEVGIPRRFIEVVGAVDLYRTGTGFEITPVVGIVTPGFTVRAQAREVADVFEVPLGHFLDEVNHQISSREYQGRQRRY